MGKMTTVYNKLMGTPAVLVGCVFLERKSSALKRSNANYPLYGTAIRRCAFICARGHI